MSPEPLILNDSAYPRPEERPPDPRPLKRPRKNPSPKQDPPYDPQVPPVVDHIFIAEGNVTKKPGGKKVCSLIEQDTRKCQTLTLGYRRHPSHAVNVEGVLVSGKGTRFILANTEQLHAKIHEMSERIRSLEEALEHCRCTPAPHPLLAPELLATKSTMGLYGGTQAGADNPNANAPSHSHAHSNGSGSASGRATEEAEERKTDIEPLRDDYNNNGGLLTTLHASSFDNHNELFQEVVRLSQCYPLPDNVSPEPNLKMREYIRSMLPPRAEADHLWDQALQNALWQYNPHPSETFYPNLAHHCYTIPTPELSPRRLALLFMILAVGCLVDLTHRPPDSPDAERYHQLARAALCEIPVMEETNVETITALFYEIWYLLVFSDKKKAAGYAWGLMGLTAKLAQSIGLHRNSAGGVKGIPEEVEKRRSLYWELLYLDARLVRSSFSSLGTSHQEWKHSCYLECLAPVLEVISQPSLEYSIVVDLDTKIRDFSFPPPLRTGNTSNSRSLQMQKASLNIALEAVLLQLHRSFFTRALSGPEESFNRRHKYAPSVVAVFLSASRMIANVQDLYHREPQLTARILGYWSNAFSAAVALCLLVSRAPFTCLSPAALQELERARMLFKSARTTCSRALQVIPILESMVRKANDIYNRWAEGQEVQTVLQHLVPTDPIAHEIVDPTHLSPIINGTTTTTTSTTTYISPSPPPCADPFSRTHRSLAQCIVEVHERARQMFPQRKPCSCTARAALCPPSHFWAPPPVVPQASPVLPDLHNYNKYEAPVLPLPPPADTRPEPGSKMAGVVETLNFELGALSAGEQIREIRIHMRNMYDDGLGESDQGLTLQRLCLPSHLTREDRTRRHGRTAVQPESHGIEPASKNANKGVIMLGHYLAPDEQGSPMQNRPGKRARNAQEDRMMMQQQPLYHHQLPLSREPLEEQTTEGKRKETRVPPDNKEKNRRLSCKECRRLKLKCDRVFPCQSCVKRGCGSLCPEGALTSGRGSRFILANTEQLHEKIGVLSDRVRQLEDALQTLHATHPLLAPELLQIKTSQDLYITPQAQTQHHPTPDLLADSTNALSLSALASTQPPYAPPSNSHLSITSGSNSNGGEFASPPDVPPDILQLSSTFPFPWSVDLRIRKRIREALPPRHEALAICEAARNNALWQYHLDASETFLQNLLHHCYSIPIQDLSPRRLALLLMILSIGSLVDLSRPLGSLYGEAYHHLARAAVCEIPLMEEPDFDVLHCLFFMIWWHLIFSDNKKAIGYAWNLMGFVAKLAQGLGLHRNSLRRRGIPEEDEKRRAVFWELLNLDARMSLSLGRPPSICLRHVDTKPPEYKGAGLYVPQEEIIYHEWKNAFFIQCLTPILEAVVVVDPPPYSTIVELDSLVRNFQIPKLLDEQPRNGSSGASGAVAPRFLTMQRALVATSRDIGEYPSPSLSAHNI
ncbi:hypothetical protein C0995_013855 [Termitomyces sp. Mi166|nr:hypothetical protein C0995_013855 [Termitomyces sp. Mi166\